MFRWTDYQYRNPNKIFVIRFDFFLQKRNPPSPLFKGGIVLIMILVIVCLLGLSKICIRINFPERRMGIESMRCLVACVASIMLS